MEDYEQLELFDLRAYTSEQSATFNGEEKQFEDIQSCSIKYIQLELDLLPQQSDKAVPELAELAA